MRGKNLAAATAVCAALLLLVPMAHGQATSLQNPNKSTPTSLYFHIFDVFNAFPINTQEPNPGFFKVGGTNFPTVVEQTSGTNYDFNTIYGYSTSGPVEYDFIENGQPRFHPERGIAADVKIDADFEHKVHIYVSVRDVLGREQSGNPAGQAPNYMPSFTFRVEMREGNEIGDPATLGAGNLIMSGSQTLTLASSHFAPLAGQTDPNGHPIVVPNEDGVVEYVIPMTIAQATIPKAQGYHVRIDWFQNPSGQAENDDRFAEGYMRIVSSDKYHNRLETAIMNPVYMEFVHPQVASGILLIHSGMNSPWGTYDVDVANITVEIKDSAGNPVQADLPKVVSQGVHVHDMHHLPAEVTYLWRFRDQGAADGQYSITLTVQNLAKTATASATAGFILEGKRAYGVDERGQTVTPGPDAEVTEESPGAGLLVLGCLLGAALVVRRRQA